MNAPLLRGKTVKLDWLAGAFRPCRWCDGTVGVLTDGKGEHRAGIRCQGCERHLSWLPKSAYSLLQSEAPRG